MGQYLVGKKEKKRPKNSRKRSITLIIAANAVLILLTMQLVSIFKKIKIKNSRKTVAASKVRKIRPRTKERKGEKKTESIERKKPKGKERKEQKKKKMKSKRRKE